MPEAGPSSTPGPGRDSTNFKAQAMKVLIKSTPLLNRDNYSMWRKKMENLFKLRGIFRLMSSTDESLELDEETNQEMVAYLIAKLDTNTYNNIINDHNKDDAKLIWIATQSHFASSQSENRARVFNSFLHLSMSTNIEIFVPTIQTYLKN